MLPIYKLKIWTDLKLRKLDNFVCLLKINMKIWSPVKLDGDRPGSPHLPNCQRREGCLQSLPYSQIFCGRFSYLAIFSHTFKKKKQGPSRRESNFKLWRGEKTQIEKTGWDFLNQLDFFSSFNWRWITNLQRPISIQVSIVHMIWSTWMIYDLWNDFRQMWESLGWKCSKKRIWYLW